MVASKAVTSLPAEFRTCLDNNNEPIIHTLLIDIDETPNRLHKLAYAEDK